MRTFTNVLLATTLGLSAALGVAAGDAPCALPSTTSAKAGAASCGLELVGAVDLSDTGAGQLAVHGDLAAVVLRDEGVVQLVDLADLSAPAALGRYDGGTGVASLDDPLDGDVAFSDDGTVLLHARQTHDASNEGLHVLDVSDPANPVLTDLVQQGGMLRVAYASVDGRELVVTQDAIAGTTIFELLRTPLGAKVVPLHVDALPALKVGGPASAGIVIVEQDPELGVPLLYLTDGATGLRVLDISDPVQPVELGAWPTQGLADIVLERRDGRVLLHAAAEYWFTKTALPELITLDVTEPASITEVARRNVGGYDGKVAWKLGGMALDGDAIEGRSLWLAHGHAGLVELDLDTGTARRATTNLGAVGLPRPDLGFVGWYAMDVLRTDDHVLVTDAVTGELRVFAER